MNADSIAARALPLLERLVAFDTTSARSNLALVEWVEGYLADHRVASERVASDDGAKANLMALIGPAVGGGVALSGHTDVVPVTGQPWTSDPWTLTRRDGRLYGRGTCDMKGFLALALAAVPDLVAAPLRRPAHLAFSYDEEVGCLGAPRLIAALARRAPAPALVVVGEPTDMRAVGSHKGVIACAVTVSGHEAHSSQTHLGVSAVMEAVGLMAVLRDLAIRLEVAGGRHHDFTPPFSTLTIGVVEGGTAANILARRCRFVFDLRTAPGIDPHALLADFRARVAAVDSGMKARFPGAGVTLEVLGDVPPLAAEPQGAAETFVRGLIGDNGPSRAVPFAAEAGQFQRAGFSTVIVGPGSIDQAHQPDEYVEVAQMQQGAAFMARLVESLSAP